MPHAWNYVGVGYGVAFVSLTTYVTWMLRRTRFGLRLRACGEDPSAAQAVGVHVAMATLLWVMAIRFGLGSRRYAAVEDRELVDA